MEAREEPFVKDWYNTSTIPTFRRALWIIGTSAAGKSTFSKTIADREETSILEAGRWAREMHCEGTDVSVMTATTLSILGKDERYFSRLINQELSKHDRLIVTGARNPIDFVDNFDVKRDGVVFLGTNAFPPQTDFEHVGVDAIKLHVAFMISCGLLPPTRVESLEPYDDAIDPG